MMTNMERIHIQALIVGTCKLLRAYNELCVRRGVETLPHDRIPGLKQCTELAYDNPEEVDYDALADV